MAVCVHTSLGVSEQVHMSRTSPAEFGVSRIEQCCNISDSINQSDFLVLKQGEGKCEAWLMPEELITNWPTRCRCRCRLRNHMLSGRRLPQSVTLRPDSLTRRWDDGTRRGHDLSTTTNLHCSTTTSHRVTASHGMSYCRVAHMQTTTP
jgi:hypothetical protein